MQNKKGSQELKTFSFEQVYGSHLFRQAADIVIEKCSGGVAIDTAEVAEIMACGNSIAYNRLEEAANMGLIRKVGKRGRFMLWLPTGVEFKDPTQSTWGGIRQCLVDGEEVKSFDIAEAIGMNPSNAAATLNKFEELGFVSKRKIVSSHWWKLTARGRKTVECRE